MASPLLLLGLLGCQGETGPVGPSGAGGPAGADGADGAAGADLRDSGVDASEFAPHDGGSPWGIHVEIVSFTGGSGAGGAFAVGDTPTLVFTVVDDDGIAYDMTDLHGVEVVFSGPSDHPQLVALYDVEGWSVPGAAEWDAAVGAWSFTLDPVGATYLPPHNDTPFYDEDDGDWGGMPLVDGTYTVGVSALRFRQVSSGVINYESDSATLDVLFGAAAELEPREVVLAESCASCHGGDVYGHAGVRRELAYCVACHVVGSEDRHSAEDSSTTPGTTVGFAALIHGIHMGEERTTPLVVNGYPANPYGAGYPDYNEYSYEGVAFPSFDNGAADCSACHDGARQGDVENRPSRAACGGCHDNVDFATGEGHDDGNDEPDDEGCIDCHAAGEEAGSIEEDHADIRDTLSAGLNLEIVSVGGATGTDGSYQPGDEITVTYTLTDDAGTTVSLYSLINTDVALAGPVEHYQSTIIGTYNQLAYESTWDEDAEVYTFTLPAIPEVYPAPVNDTTDVGVPAGERQGEQLVAGTYTLMLMASEQHIVGYSYYQVSDGDTAEILLGSAGALSSRTVVSEANCESCHAQVEAHGGVRSGLAACLVCHTAGTEDRYSVEDVLSTPGVTVHFPVLIHKIHAASSLAEPWTVNGYAADPYLPGYPNYNAHTYSSLEFPRFDGGVQACAACHAGDDAWEDPQAVACLACHDTPDAAAHAAVNTDDVWGESCDVCHGTGREFAVADMHDWLR